MDILKETLHYRLAKTPEGKYTVIRISDGKELPHAEGAWAKTWADRLLNNVDDFTFEKTMDYEFKTLDD